MCNYITINLKSLLLTVLKCYFNMNFTLLTPNIIHYVALWAQVYEKIIYVITTIGKPQVLLLFLVQSL